MRIWLSFFGIAFALMILGGSFSAAFEIQYPGESGFFLGRSMVYEIAVDSSNDQNVGKEGIFTFGSDIATIGGKDYYDWIFVSPSSEGHFYMGIDPVKSALLEKGLSIGTGEVVLNPAATAALYPLIAGKTWKETISLKVNNLEIPGLGALGSVSVDNAEAVSKVSSKVIQVPAGEFETLLVETTFSGTLKLEGFPLPLPVVLIQRTWMSEDNVPVKRYFDASILGSLIPLYEIQLSKTTPRTWDPNGDRAVNIEDVIIVAQHFGQHIAKPITTNPDINDDGVVDIFDLVAVGLHFGETYNSKLAPAKYATADLSHEDLALLRGVYANVTEHINEASGDNLVGLERLLCALDTVFAEPPSPRVVKSALFQSFPNPCNPEVWIPYALAVDCPVEISVYNTLGQLVRKLDLGYRPAGMYVAKETAAYWNGENADGEKVASGIYFYTIHAGDFSATKRMLVLK